MGESPPVGRRDASARIERLHDWEGGRGCERELTSRTCRQYLFFHSGSGEVSLAGASHPLTAGTHAAIPNGVAARIRIDPGSRGILLATPETFLRSRVLPVLFVPSPEHWRRYGVPFVGRLTDGEANAALRDRMLEDLEHAAERLGGFCDAAVVAYAFVVMGSAPSKSSVPQPVADRAPSDLAPAQLVMRFRELIETSFKSHITIEEYAQQLAVTPVRLARACKSTTNRTPLALIQERIIVEAKGELSYSQRSVAEIAYSLGFTDAAYFNRFFKQQTGEPPLQYRRLTAPQPLGTARAS